MSKNHYPLEFLEIKYIMNTSIDVWRGEVQTPWNPSRKSAIVHREVLAQQQRKLFTIGGPKFVARFFEGRTDFADDCLAIVYNVNRR